MRVFRKTSRLLALAGLFLLSTTFALAEPYHDSYRQGGNGNAGWRNSKPYQQGYRDGNHDRARGGSARPNLKRWKNNNDRSAYQAGYADGYRSAFYGRGPYNNGGYYGGGYPNPGVPSGPPRYGSPVFSDRTASQFGYQDGFNDGVRDRQTGHSFRPTNGKAYRDADHGYSSTLGSKDYYKQAFRQAYISGYQRGYSGR
jgi:hypothetical protein